MKAVRYHSYGDSDVLVYEDTDRPGAGEGQVVVRVASTAFSPADAAIRAGFLHEVFPLAFPHIPGYDVAGVITEVGEGVSEWKAGDAVVAFLPMNQPGAAAEYATVPAEALARAPKSVNLADAAALPSTGLTAWQSLFVHADLKAGQNVLVNGAGGAVGGYAVQLARQAGATVIATASPRRRRPPALLWRRADHRLPGHTTASGGGRTAVRCGAEPGAHQPRGDRGSRGPGRRRRSVRQHDHPGP